VVRSGKLPVSRTKGTTPCQDLCCPATRETHRRVLDQKKTAISPCSRVEAVGWIRSSRTLRAWVTTWRVPTLGRTGSYRRIREYHSDTIIVNDLVTSRVRKRTFRFASCSRFDTAVLRVVAGCKFSGELLHSRNESSGTVDRVESPASRPWELCEEFLEVGCWVVDSQDWACIKDPTFGGSRLE
jgi:hypothetical protein